MMNMKLNKLLIAFLASATLAGCSAQVINQKSIVADAETQTRLKLQSADKALAEAPALVSPRTIVDGKLKMVVSRDWTSGFFPGQLWYLYELTGDKSWKAEAIRYTELSKKEQFNKGTHDLGFMIYCPFGNGYRLTQDTAYRSVIIQAAKSLSSRFSPKTGTIKSWDHNTQLWTYPVIIDNMMNLELLFNATKFSGDSTFYKIAVTHANTTLKNHFRPDNSSYHVVDYDPQTGRVVKRLTHQGYADESAWARGQAWGLYGFTLCYRETGNPAYLEQARKIAAFMLNHPRLPADKVPYWDFDAPNIPDAPRDASAATITASALYQLAELAKDKSYRETADKIMSSLTRSYRSPLNQNFGFILLHSTGHLPAKSEIDVPINYADYYYLEALLRKKRPFLN